MRTTVPIRMVGGAQPLLVLEASIQGSAPLDCALDTGASHCVLLPEVAKRLGVRADEVRQAAGAGGALEVRLGRADSIAVGEAMVRDVPLIVSDELKRIGAAIGHSIGGNLGHSFLGGYRMTLDYAGLELELASAEEPDDTRPARADLAFELAHPLKPLIMIPVRLGARLARFALDTGASISVLSPEMARQCELETAHMPGMTGGGGAVAAAAALIPELAIEQVTISRVRVAVAEFLTMLSGTIGTQIDGILGTNVLRRFRVTIDYPRQRIRLG